MTVRCCVANVSNVTFCFLYVRCQKNPKKRVSFFLLYIDNGLQSIFVVIESITKKAVFKHAKNKKKAI
jgi:hypothetical protein